MAKIEVILGAESSFSEQHKLVPLDNPVDSPILIDVLVVNLEQAIHRLLLFVTTTAATTAARGEHGQSIVHLPARFIQREHGILAVALSITSQSANLLTKIVKLFPLLEHKAYGATGIDARYGHFASNARVVRVDGELVQWDGWLTIMRIQANEVIVLEANEVE